jgi:hypothetical protein
MASCTAAISEVYFREGPGYEAEVEFITRDSWEREIALLRADIADEQATDDTEVDLTIPRAARQKLQAVYRPEGVTGSIVLDLDHLTEPLEIAEALDQGSVHFSSGNLDDFRKRIRKYLDAQERFWPIVKAVRVGGAFPALSGGAKLICPASAGNGKSALPLR